MATSATSGYSGVAQRAGAGRGASIRLLRSVTLSRLLVRLLPGKILGYVWHNPLFDSSWYLAQYADVRTAKQHAERHYRRHGVFEGRMPSAGFDTSWYLRTYPDVAMKRLNPLDHYLLFGRDEGRRQNGRDPG